MADTLQKIPVLQEFVKQHKPADFSLDTASWFKKESCSINFGEYTGSYGTVGALRASVLNPMFAQGWYVVSATDNTQIKSPEEPRKTVRTETHGGKDVVGTEGSDTTTGWGSAVRGYRCRARFSSVPATGANSRTPRGRSCSDVRSSPSSDHRRSRADSRTRS